MTPELPGQRARVERLAVAAIVSALLLSFVFYVVFEQAWARHLSSPVIALTLGVLVVREVRRKRAAARLSL
jgi:hypothetical protein